MFGEGPIAVDAASVGPVGLGLGSGVGVEHVFQDGTLGRAEVGPQAPRSVDAVLGERQRAPVVGELGFLGRAVGVGQSLPLGQPSDEVVIRERGRHLGDHRIGSGHELLHSGVGRRPADGLDRSRRHASIGDGCLDARKPAQRSGVAHPGVGFGAGQPPEMLQRRLGAAMTVDGVGRGAVDMAGQSVGAVVDSPAGDLHRADELQHLLGRHAGEVERLEPPGGVEQIGEHGFR